MSCSQITPTACCGCPGMAPRGRQRARPDLPAAVCRAAAAPPRAPMMPPRQGPPRGLLNVILGSRARRVCRGPPPRRAPTPSPHRRLRAGPTLAHTPPPRCRVRGRGWGHAAALHRGSALAMAARPDACLRAGSRWQTRPCPAPATRRAALPARAPALRPLTPRRLLQGVPLARPELARPCRTPAWLPAPSRAPPRWLGARVGGQKRARGVGQGLRVVGAATLQSPAAQPWCPKVGRGTSARRSPRAAASTHPPGHHTRTRPRRCSWRLCCHGHTTCATRGT